MTGCKSAYTSAFEDSQPAQSYLHSFGGLTTSSHSAQIQASVGRVGQLQLEGGALTQDGHPDSVQAIDLDWQHLMVHASLAGAESDADILAGSRNKHAGWAIYHQAVCVLIPATPYFRLEACTPCSHTLVLYRHELLYHWLAAWTDTGLHTMVTHTGLGGCNARGQKQECSTLLCVHSQYLLMLCHNHRKSRDAGECCVLYVKAEI